MWLSKKGIKLNIDKIKNYVKKLVGSKLKIKVYLGRNKYLYYDGYIEIHAKCNEVRQFGVKALKLDNLNKLEIIKNVESGYDDDSYITLNVEVTKDEYYNLVFIKRKVQKST